MLYNLFENRDFVSVFAVALLAEGVDRNSVSVRRSVCRPQVALLAEGVDRNYRGCCAYVFVRVALLAEGVDRNRSNATGTLDSWVALLAEGVDRNLLG